MTTSPQAVLNNLQGHQVVLAQELAEINNDIEILQGMHNRYSTQNGIYFDAAVHNLIALKCEKEALYHNITGQVSNLNDTLLQTTMLAQNLSRGLGATAPHMNINTTFNNPNASTMHSNVSAINRTTTAGSGMINIGGVSYIAVPGNASVLNATVSNNNNNMNGSCIHCPTHGVSAALGVTSPYRSAAASHHHSHGGAPAAVNINTPGGLVVTTNSSILTNSPRRVYRQ